MQVTRGCAVFLLTPLVYLVSRTFTQVTNKVALTTWSHRQNVAEKNKLVFSKVRGACWDFFSNSLNLPLSSFLRQTSAAEGFPAPGAGTLNTIRVAHCEDHHQDNERGNVVVGGGVRSSTLVHLGHTLFPNELISKVPASSRKL